MVSAREREMAGCGLLGTGWDVVGVRRAERMNKIFGGSVFMIDVLQCDVRLPIFHGPVERYKYPSDQSDEALRGRQVGRMLGLSCRQMHQCFSRTRNGRLGTCIAAEVRG